jgi:hypothetical protein
MNLWPRLSVTSRFALKIRSYDKLNTMIIKPEGQYGSLAETQSTAARGSKTKLKFVYELTCSFPFLRHPRNHASAPFIKIIFHRQRSKSGTTLESAVSNPTNRGVPRDLAEQAPLAEIVALHFDRHTPDKVSWVTFPATTGHNQYVISSGP